MGASTASLSNLILLSSGASAVTNLAGAFAQSAALRAQGDYEHSLNNRNAGYAERDAQEALRAGDVAANRYGSQIRQLQGQQRAAAASQGVEVGTGSAGEIVDETGRLGALDMLTIRNNAAREAYGYDVQAGDYRHQGRMARNMGKSQSRQTLATGGLRFLREMAHAKYVSDHFRTPGKPYGPPGGKNMSDPRNR